MRASLLNISLAPLDPCNTGIQFLDGNGQVILDLLVDARNAAGAIALVADVDWPPAGAAVPASIGRAKVVGLIVEKSARGNPGDFSIAGERL
jgi:hypothetical protein